MKRDYVCLKDRPCPNLGASIVDVIPRATKPDEHCQWPCSPVGPHLLLKQISQVWEEPHLVPPRYPAAFKAISPGVVVYRYGDRCCPEIHVQRYLAPGEVLVRSIGKLGERVISLVDICGDAPYAGWRDARAT
jgi:hypothetical protein